MSTFYYCRYRGSFDCVLDKGGYARLHTTMHMAQVYGDTHAGPNTYWICDLDGVNALPNPPIFVIPDLIDIDLWPHRLLPGGLVNTQEATPASPARVPRAAKRRINLRGGPPPEAPKTAAPTRPVSGGREKYATWVELPFDILPLGTTFTLHHPRNLNLVWIKISALHACLEGWDEDSPRQRFYPDQKVWSSAPLHEYRATKGITPESS